MCRVLIHSTPLHSASAGLELQSKGQDKYNRSVKESGKQAFHASSLCGRIVITTHYGCVCVCVCVCTGMGVCLYTESP